MNLRMRLRSNGMNIAAGICLLAIGLCAALWWTFGSPSARRGDLWRLVHDVCISDEALIDRPAPCLRVDRQGGYALVPGYRHADELLLVPTIRITGIEDPTLLATGAVNYWAQAWDARTLLLGNTRPIPRDWIALAVNSVHARTQDQLHIHIDCVRAPVHAALAADPPADGVWRTIEPLPGHRYLATYLPETIMRTVSPFRALAASIGGDSQTMGLQTLVMIGASAEGRPGFYLLRQAYDPAIGAQGHGEELLDHACKSLPPALDATS